MASRKGEIDGVMYRQVRIVDVVGQLIGRDDQSLRPMHLHRPQPCRPVSVRRPG